MIAIKKLAASSLVFLLTLSSCTTFRANMLLINQTSDSQKAELLYVNGLEKYNNDIIKNNDLTAIPAVRTRFKDALKTDPSHAKAKKALDDLAFFEDKQKALWLDTAKTLHAKTKRTAAEDYELVLAVKKLGDLKHGGSETALIKKETKELRGSIIDTRETDLAAIQAKIEASTERTARLRLLRSAQKASADLLAIDPSNGKAKQAGQFASDEIAAIEAQDTAAKTGAKPATTPAKTRTTTRLAPVAEYDHDADIQIILSSIDAQIKARKPAGALAVIQEKKPVLKNAENLKLIAAKEEEVRALVKTIYAEGIKQYNAEDYEGAKRNFTLVVQYSANYEQAQAYLDKTNTKIRALAGQ